MSGTSSQWRKLAQETRAIAERETTDPESKRLLLEIAAAYDRLAALAKG
jgi:hypothetical protein